MRFEAREKARKVADLESMIREFELMTVDRLKDVARRGPRPGPVSAPVDIEAILVAKANDKGGGGNWRTSIVDLLKLLDIDSSLEARKALAAELNVNAGAHGSAEQNIALSKAVWKKLADNGGRVPASLKD